MMAEYHAPYPSKVGSANNAMEWQQYHAHRMAVFGYIRANLSIPPKSCLDIGCGLAIETGMLQREFSCSLHFLEGDADSTNPCSRLTRYGSADSMRFYLPVEELRRSWDSRGLDYTFVDARAPKIEDGLTFDLIYSFRSCGFHYPLSTYVELIRKHSGENTRLLFDLRDYADQGIAFKVVDVIMEFRKSKLCHIELAA